MKSKALHFSASIIGGLYLFSAPYAHADTNTIVITIGPGTTLIGNNLDNGRGNYANDVLSNSLAGMTFYPFDNNTTTLGPYMTYQCDFFPPGACGWQDPTGSPVTRFPQFNPGQGAFVQNPVQPGQLAITGTPPGGYLPLPPLNTWCLVSCLSIIHDARFQDIFGVPPSTTPGVITRVALWNGVTFQIYNYMPFTSGPPGGTWTIGGYGPVPEPLINLGHAAFVEIDPGFQFAPIAAAVDPACVGNTLLLTFNRDVDLNTAQQASNYTVNVLGNPVAAQSASVYGTTPPFFAVPSSKLVLLTLTSDLVNPGTVTVNGVADLAGDMITSNSSVTFQPTLAPHLVMAQPGSDNTHVLLTFDRPLDAATADNAANYQIFVSRGTPPTVLGAALLGPASVPNYPGDLVRLTVSGLNSDTVYTVSVNNVNSACHSTIQPNSNASFVLAVNYPTLSAQPSGTDLLLSWQGTNYVLQQNADLKVPGGWVNTTATLGITNNTVTARVPIGAGRMFFRVVLE
jgi:hypothetical protein